MSLNSGMMHPRRALVERVSTCCTMVECMRAAAPGLSRRAMYSMISSRSFTAAMDHRTRHWLDTLLEFLQFPSEMGFHPGMADRTALPVIIFSLAH